jgi:drug/metabolite transporter (DMT)-like permease
VGERVQTIYWFAVALAFAGAVVIAAPSPSTLGPSAALATASAFLAAIAYVSVRALRSTDSPHTIVWAFSVASVLGSAPSVLMLRRLPCPAEWASLAAVGLCAYLGQIWMTMAYARARAAYVSALSYATVAFGVLLGVTTFQEPLTLWDGVGIAAIVGAGVWMSALELRTQSGHATTEALR